MTYMVKIPKEDGFTELFMSSIQTDGTWEYQLYADTPAETWLDYTIYLVICEADSMDEYGTIEGDYSMIIIEYVSDPEYSYYLTQIIISQYEDGNYCQLYSNDTDIDISTLFTTGLNFKITMDGSGNTEFFINDTSIDTPENIGVPETVNGMLFMIGSTMDVINSYLEYVKTIGHSGTGGFYYECTGGGGGES